MVNIAQISKDYDVSGIYSISDNIKNRIYIGSSNSIYRRIKYEHLRSLQLNKHINKYLQNHFNKYGSDSLFVNIIEQCDNSILFEREQHYLNIFYGKKCFNISKIAEGSRTVYVSLSTRKKQSESAKKRGRHISLDKNIFQYSLDGIFIKKFENAVEATKYLGIKKICGTNLNNCALFKKQTAYGYIWRRYYSERLNDEDLSLSRPKKYSLSRQIKIINPKTMEIIIADSIVDASNITGNTETSICACCRGRMKSSKGLMFEYYE